MILCAWCYLSDARIVSMLDWTGGKRMIVLLVHTLVALTPSSSSISFIAWFSEDEKDPTLFLPYDELRCTYKWTNSGGGIHGHLMYHVRMVWLPFGIISAPWWNDCDLMCSCDVLSYCVGSFLTTLHNPPSSLVGVMHQ